MRVLNICTYVICLLLCICCSLFPLLLCYDEHINLSIVGYFGIVKTISSNHNELSQIPALVSMLQSKVNHIILLHVHRQTCMLWWYLKGQYGSTKPFKLWCTEVIQCLLQLICFLLCLCLSCITTGHKWNDFTACKIITKLKQLLSIALSL